MSTTYELLRREAVRYSSLSLSYFLVEGPDAAQYLHGQTSSDVKSLELGQIQPSALLDPKARTLALMHIGRVAEQKFLLICWKACATQLFERLQQYIIMDEVEIKELKFASQLISGPQAHEVLTKAELPIVEHDGIAAAGEDAWLTHFNLFGESDFLWLSPASTALPAPIQALPELSEDDFQSARIEAGVPLYGQDLTEKTLFPETGLQTSRVSFSKGCFAGQEIVARVKYRGSVNRLLYALRLQDCKNGEPQLGDIVIRGKKEGRITSLCRSPHFDGDWLALAYLGKNVRKPDSQHIIEGEGGFSAKGLVCNLPVYQRLSSIEEAQQIFDDAIDLFTASSSADNDAQVEKLFRESIRLNPAYADAYEALGVLLSRNDRFDEAIDLMKRLVDIAPEEVMGYTNLSVFYMKKGMIEEAEEEKTRATVAGFKKAAKERKVRIADEEVLKQQQAEVERRVAMFHQVLEIDPDDLVANFGLAKYFLDKGDYEGAYCHSESCIKHKKDYSSAYLIQGKALLAMKKTQEAVLVFKTGIHYARERGELLPQKEMEQVLARIP